MVISVAIFKFVEIEADDTIEIHCNGEFLAGYSLSAFNKDPKGVCKNMLSSVFNEGKLEAKKEIKKALGL